VAITAREHQPGSEIPISNCTEEVCFMTGRNLIALQQTGSRTLPCSWLVPF
jgi:hypothetical protein